MPIYDYQVSATGEVFEVIHSSSVELTTWKELAPLIGKELGSLPDETPVVRQIAGRVFVNGNLEDLSKGKVVQQPPKRLRGGCCGGGCGQ